MAAILELLRYSNFVAEDDAGTSTEGKFGMPHFGGEPTRLAEYAFRVKACLYKEKTLSKEEKEKLGPLGPRLVEGLTGTRLRLAQTLSLDDLAKEDAWRGNSSPSVSSRHASSMLLAPLCPASCRARVASR